MNSDPYLRINYIHVTWLQLWSRPVLPIRHYRHCA